MPLRWALCAATAAGLACFGPAIRPARAGGEDGSSREYQVKAAFVAKFVQFVEWPADSMGKPGDPIVIAVLDDANGHDPFDGAMDQLVGGKAVNGRPIKVRHVQPGNVGDCHVLFVPASQDAKVEQVIKGVAGHSVLTVGETDAFPWAGGDVRFYLEDNKVRFEINPDAAKAAGLTVSAKLLALARIFKKA